MWGCGITGRVRADMTTYLAGASKHLLPSPPLNDKRASLSDGVRTGPILVSVVCNAPLYKQKR